LQEEKSLPDALRQAQMWVRQVTAAKLAQRFGEEYKTLMADKMSAAEAIDFWQQFAAMNGNKKPFSHPYFWAAFTFTGA
jgi:CHAT domain-containing protein